MKILNRIGTAGQAVGNSVKRNAGKLVAAGAVVGAFAASKAQAAMDIVTYSNGEVAFTPENLVGPVVTGVVAAVGAGAVLVVISVGVRWIYRMVKVR